VNGRSFVSNPDALAFELADIAARVEAMDRAQHDELSYGCIKIDADGVVREFNKTEARLSGYKNRPALDTRFFIDVAPCMSGEFFKGRIDKARASGTLDITFTFVGDFSDAKRTLVVRTVGATDGGAWIFIKR
jgi:photoactive yellow protein